MILVTGATGFVGRNFVRHIHKREKPICFVKNKSPRKAHLTGTEHTKVFGDIRNIDSIKKAIGDENIDRIISLVGIHREFPKDDDTFDKINHEGMMNLVKAAKELGIKKIVHLSVIGAADDSKSPFLQSKWLAEETLKSGGVPYTILRSSFIFGKESPLFQNLLSYIKISPRVPILGDDSVRHQPIWINDVARCLYESLNKKHDKMIYAIGGPQHFSFEVMTEIILSTMKTEKKKVKIPLGIVTPCVKLVETFKKDLPIAFGELQMLQRGTITKANIVESIFGFAPRKLADDLAEYV